MLLIWQSKSTVTLLKCLTQWPDSRANLKLPVSAWDLLWQDLNATLLQPLRNSRQQCFSNGCPQRNVSLLSLFCRRKIWCGTITWRSVKCKVADMLQPWILNLQKCNVHGRIQNQYAGNPTKTSLKTYHIARRTKMLVDRCDFFNFKNNLPKYLENKTVNISKLPYVETEKKSSM